MDDINDNIIRLEKEIANSIKSVKNYEESVEDFEDYFEAIEVIITHIYHYDKFELEIEKLYNSVNFLKDILYRKLKLLKYSRSSA